MRLPANFQRAWVKGSTDRGSAPANGWKVRVFDKAVFIPRKCVEAPGAVRKRLEVVLGIDGRSKKTREDEIVAHARKVALARRNFRNKIAKEGPGLPPWARPRTFAKIVAEERTLAVSQKWQRMGVMRG